MIQTVNGKIKKEDLGICAAHEHLSIDLSRIKNDPDTILDDEDGMITELEHFYQAVRRSMSELTNNARRRHVSRLKTLSEATDVHRATCTGSHEDPCTPKRAQAWHHDQFAEHFIKESNE